MFSFSRFRGIDDGRSDEDDVPGIKDSKENEYGRGVGFDDYGNDSFEDVAEREEESIGYTDFKNNNRTINCSSVENDEDDGKIRFDHVDTDGNSDENGEDDSRIGFDDGDTDSLDKVDELEEDLNSYTVAQLKVKLAEQGLIQTGKKPDLIQRILKPQPSDFKKKAKLSRGEPARPKHFLSDSSVTNLHAFKV